jgi:hypothetical protein
LYKLSGRRLEPGATATVICAITVAPRGRSGCGRRQRCSAALASIAAYMPAPPIRPSGRRFQHRGGSAHAGFRPGSYIVAGSIESLAAACGSFPAGTTPDQPDVDQDTIVAA